MIKVGITGQAGFIGTHLFNFLNLQEGIKTIPFQDEYFQSPEILTKWAGECDAIVHLAALNRHNDSDTIYKTNIELVKQLIDAIKKAGTKPHVLFSSSSQEERDNVYGKSKKEGRLLFEKWADESNSKFTGFIIPNVFGPFGNPYYNSVIATFCHQLAHNEEPEIHVDAEINLIYVNELVHEIFEHIIAMSNKKEDFTIIDTVEVEYTAQMKVSEILIKLKEYKNQYVERGIFPNLDNPFYRNLFNTFLCYCDLKNLFPAKLVMNEDERGSFVETVKLNSGGQVSFSTTKPGITRGNHFHTRKAERFAVIKGKARIQLRRIGTKEILNFELDGSQPAYVDMPVWYTHNIQNIGDEDLYTIFWINEFFNPNDPDTFYEKV